MYAPPWWSDYPTEQRDKTTAHVAKCTGFGLRTAGTAGAIATIMITLLIAVMFIPAALMFGATVFFKTVGFLMGDAK